MNPNVYANFSVSMLFQRNELYGFCVQLLLMVLLRVMILELVPFTVHIWMMLLWVLLCCRARGCCCERRAAVFYAPMCLELLGLM